MGEGVAAAGAASPDKIIRDALVRSVRGKKFGHQNRVGTASGHQQKVPLPAI